MASKWNCTVCGNFDFVTNGVCDDCTESGKSGFSIAEIEKVAKKYAHIPAIVTRCNRAIEEARS